jgi:hypothetical protein
MVWPSSESWTSDIAGKRLYASNGAAEAVMQMLNAASPARAANTRLFMEIPVLSLWRTRNLGMRLASPARVTSWFRDANYACAAVCKT